MLTNDLPQKYEIKFINQKHIYNEESVLIPSPNGMVRVQQSLKYRLQARLKQVQKVSGNLLDKLWVKLWSDGTDVAQSMHLINFLFTIVIEKNRNTPGGNHTLPIFKAPGSYEDLKLGLSDISHEVNS